MVPLLPGYNGVALSLFYYVAFSHLFIHNDYLDIVQIRLNNSVPFMVPLYSFLITFQSVTPMLNSERVAQNQDDMKSSQTFLVNV